MADPRRKDAIWTFTGRVVRPLDPNPDDLCIEDIAHALANQCRFTGHVRRFYSVAQHSVYVSQLLEDVGRGYCALWGLLHDASEAYLSDIARPVKKAEPLSEVYKTVEDKLMDAVVAKFGLEPWWMPDEVHEADRSVGRAESIDLMPPDFPLESWGPEPSFTFKRKIRPWLPEDAEERFLRRFRRLS